LVLKWFISTLKQQYSSRNENLGSEKKPLNPFLGELFLAEWKGDADNVLKLASEQVSHHPPVTAYHISDADNSIFLEGYNGQKASISKTLTISVKQIGHATLKIPAYNETYIISLPALHIEGLMTGAPYVELSKSSYIVSSSGYTSKIDYSGKGWLSGKKNSFTATTYPSDKPKNILYMADGQWTGAFCIKDANKKEIESYDPVVFPAVPPTVTPITEQSPLETRRAWSKVAEAIKKGDMDAVHKEKTIIETQQREQRKKEKEEGTEWPRKYFMRLEKDPVFESLAKKVGEAPEADKTDGIWVWKE